MKLKRKRRLFAVPMASMADVAFLLLVFLIVASSLDTNPEPDITLPSHPDAHGIESDREYAVILDSSGAIWAEGNQLDARGLGQRLSAQASRRPDTVFFIKADAAVPFRHVQTVLDIFKERTIRAVVFEARKEEPRVSQ